MIKWFKKTNRAADAVTKTADNLNSLIDETREAVKTTEKDIVRSAKIATVCSIVKASFTVVIAGLVGFIAYKVGTDE
jgi:hypothetical protein